MSHLERLLKMDRLWLAAQTGETEAVIDGLADPDWEIVQIACSAARKHPRAEYGPALGQVLAHQNTLDVNGQHDLGLIYLKADREEDVLTSRVELYDKATLEAWKCRWRVKQMACLALQAMGEQGQIGAISPETIDRLCTYALDSDGEDLGVRAAACDALGDIGGDKARTTLEQATGDEEFCTMTAATKGLAKVSS